MSISSDDTVVESFLAQVEAECADLPADVRQRLMANLASHLRELDELELFVACEDPVAYARELREALNLGPSSTAAAVTLSAPPRRRFALRRWVLAAALTAVTTASGVAVGYALTDGKDTVRPPGRAGDPTLMPAPLIDLPVPDVVGLPADAAKEYLYGVGLQVTVRWGAAAGPGGAKVIDQDPKANVTVEAGTAVTIYLGPAE